MHAPAGQNAPRRVNSWHTAGIYGGAIALAGMLSLGIVDVVLAFIGGVLIGIALGYWLLPAVVDAIERGVTTGRIHRHRGP